jgi:glycosyltransferase involved in cell wall biosynthesis
MTKGSAARRDVYLDIAPIFETEWTGVPTVTAQLAQYGLADKRRVWRFLYNNQMMDEAIVRDVMAARSGRWVVSSLLDILADCLLPSFESMRESVAIFPNVKAGRRMFWREAIVVHDLSTILMPHYHHQDTILHHANRVRGDVESSDSVICVSRATADDVMAYFKVPENKIVVAPLGVSWPLRTRLEAAKLLEGVELPPFVLVLGTIEPRKNIGLVLEFIKRQPSVLNDYHFVFVGRDGWLDERVKLERRLTELGVGAERIVFAGYVSEAMKLALLCAAAFTIYPSMFEGFGLPVLESISVGCPVLCSMSSSLPEVVDEHCVLFDPTDGGSFSAAFAKMHKVAAAKRRRVADPLNLPSADHFGWGRFCQPIAAWLEGLDERFGQ